MGFIYKVTNNINGKVYIGQSTMPIEIRYKEHLRDSKRFSKRPFYYALQKYGELNFSLELVEEVPNNELNQAEQYWIKYYNSYVGFDNSNGYNATLGGDSKLLYDYYAIGQDYLQTKSKTLTAKHFNCCVETVTRALVSLDITILNHSSGRPIKSVDNEGQVFYYSSIQQAAQIVSNKLQNNPQTVRKRINKVLLHCPNQEAYGCFWYFI